jgi:hypothetical protein
LRRELLDDARDTLSRDRPSRDRRFADTVALVNASWSGDLRRVRAILAEQPVLAHAPDAHGWLPLHHAARRGQTDVVRLLLDHAADPNVGEGGWGWTPLHLAYAAGHVETQAALEAGGANLGIVGARCCMTGPDWRAIGALELVRCTGPLTLGTRQSSRCCWRTPRR